MKFKKGNRVKLPCNGYQLSEYEFDGIPKDLRNGNGTDETKDGTGVVVDFYSEWVLVKYIDKDDKTLILGFNPNSLTLIRNGENKLTPSLNGISVGDTIEFIGNSGNGDVDWAYDSDYDRSLVVHGSVMYDNNSGEVVHIDIKSKLFYVKYLDSTKKYVTLAFTKQNIKLKSKNNQNEYQEESNPGIKVQRPSATVTKGERRSGSGLSGRRSKTTIAIGHLSHQEIVG